MLQLNEVIITLYDALACYIAKSLQKKPPQPGWLTIYILIRGLIWWLPQVPGYHSMIIPR